MPLLETFGNAAARAWYAISSGIGGLIGLTFLASMGLLLMRITLALR